MTAWPATPSGSWPTTPATSRATRPRPPRPSWRIADDEAPPLHLLLGEDALKYAGYAAAGLAADIDAWKDLTLSIGFAERPVRPGRLGALFLVTRFLHDRSRKRL